MSTRTTDLDPFELELRQRLHRLADHAPTTVPERADTLVVRPIADGRRGRRIAGIGATIAVLAGGVGLTTIGLQGAAQPGGADSPEEAVREFADAMAAEDVLGMIEVTVPEEVTALRTALEETADEAERLGLVDDSFALDGIAGIDVTVADLALTTESLAPDLVAVTAASGSLAAAFDRVAFPTGRMLAGVELSSGSASRDLATAPITLVTVQRDDHWFVSVGMSIAEAIRRAEGGAMPSDLGVLLEGSPTPEAAADAFLGHLADLDLRAASSLVAAGEGDVFRRYGSLWLPSAERGVDDLRRSGLSITIPELEWVRVVDDDGRVTLDPASYVVEGTLPASWSGEDTAGMIRVPEWPTIVQSGDGQGGVWVLDAGVSVPATVDELPVDRLPDEDPAVQELYRSGEYNPTWANADGTIEPLIDPLPPDAAPIPFRVERRDGCSTASGAFADVVGRATSTEQLADGSIRTCDDGDLAGVGSALVLLAGGASVLDLPQLTLVEHDGEWFVSPIGTIAGQWLEQMRRLPDDANLIDVPLLAAVAGVRGRAELDQLLGSRDPIPTACAPIAEAAADGSVSVVADPDVADVRSCLDVLWGADGSWSAATDGGSEVTVEVGPAEEVVTVTAPPASTP
jgi:hypothetical protein